MRTYPKKEVLKIEKNSFKTHYKGFKANYSNKCSQFYLLKDQKCEISHQ